MRKGVAVSTIVLSTALALSGCMTKQGDVGNKNIRSNSYRMQSQGMNGTRFANDGANELNRIRGTQQMNNNVVGLHGNSRMEISQAIADKLTALPEVKSAYVALTNKNAYVAIVEDRDSSKVHLNRHGGTTGMTGSTGTTGMTGTGHYGAKSLTGNGMGTNADRGTGPSNPNTFRMHTGGLGSAVPRTGMMSGEPRMKNYSFKGTSAGGTAQSGTAGMTSAEVSDMLKNKVADIVKAMAPTTNNVYVSANADFYTRMQKYSSDAMNGHPIQGMITEFNALVERIFPQAAGTTPHAKTAPGYYSSTTPRAGGYGMNGMNR